MLQISNLDDAKTEWSINETHLIIPMIDGEIREADKIQRNAIPFNAFDVMEQANGMEHSFVIGLDRNLFESYASKSDFLLIQNSDSKNQIAYALSYVEPDKSEILWESPTSKERSKSDWCPTDRVIFEVKDVLNCDDSHQDSSSSKNWREDMDKTDEVIRLDEMGGDLSSQKIDEGILIESTINGDKKNDTDSESQFIVSCYPQNCSLMLPNHTNSIEIVENPKKSITTTNDEIIPNCTQPHSPNLIPQLSKLIVESSKKIDETNLNKIKIQNKKRQTMTTQQLLPQAHKTEIKPKILMNPTKESKPERSESNDIIQSCLLEKSLPLKKKAKMKTTVMSFGCENFKSKQEFVEIPLEKMESASNKERSNTLSGSHLQGDNSVDSYEPLISWDRKRKKSVKVKSTETKLSRVGKVKNCIKNIVHESEEFDKSGNIFVGEADSDDGKDSKTATKIFKKSLFQLDKSKFKTIYDLVEGLKKSRLISTSVWQTLQSGLKEMNVDVLEEMEKERNEERTDSTCYSTQLKAFALVLYFKQPAAFNYLAKLYPNGWPSLNVIKEWKRRVNSRQRPNFVGMQRDDNS